MHEVRLADTGTADTILTGGTVRTGSTVGDAVAIHDGAVLATGTNRDMLALAGERTEHIDLAGRTAVPGFVESHTHPYFFGLTRAADVDAGTPPNDSIADIVEWVAAACADAARGEWIVGYRYDDTLLAERRHPTRSDLDAVAPGHPVVLVHVSGHFVTANSLALAAAGIDGKTVDPPGGTIVRDTSGRPTGTLAETAAFPVYALLPKRSTAEMSEILGLAGDAYLAAGVTTVHDTGIGLVGGLGELDAYAHAIATGRVRTRVRGYVLNGLLAELGDGVSVPAAAQPSGVDPEQFAIAGVKIISDGSIQGLTGCLSEPYTCSPGEHGMMLLTEAELATRVAQLHGAGWQIAVHGNGDAAIQAIIDAYAALGVDSDGVHRHRIEHCQTVRDDQLATMAEHDILASFFVKHVYYWGDRHRDTFLGERRAERISPLQTAAANGIRYGLHADTPVTPVPPLEGIACAVRRRTREGTQLGPNERVDAAAALRAYTADAAYLGGANHPTGTLEEGAAADIAVLSDDIVSISANRIDAVTVDATFIGGELVWRRTADVLDS